MNYKGEVIYMQVNPIFDENEYEYEEPDSPEWEEKSRYTEQLKEDLCPTGFRFFSNMSIDSQTNQLNCYAVRVGFEHMTMTEYISKLKEKYGDVQLTGAYDCYGRYIDGFTGLRFNEPRDIWYGVFVKCD